MSRIVNDQVRCGRCSQYKDKAAFYKHSGRPDGFAAYCKECERNFQPRKATGLGQKKKSAMEKFLVRTYDKYLCGAKARGKAFYLSRQQYAEVIFNHCQYCGGYNTSSVELGINYCGIDRVDNKKGYVAGNCVPCCDVCNKMKSTHTLEFFIDHVEKIHDHHVDIDEPPMYYI